MDFSLDADFDKLPSFKMDMSGLDISSPTKKSGKSKEISKEVSSGGANRAKRDSFAFSYDFYEFPDLGFESKKTKIDDNTNKSKDKEGYSNASSSGDSGNFLAKDVDASEDDDISLKHPASWGVTNSQVDTQTDNIKVPDPRNEDDNLKSVIDESSLLKPAYSAEQETHRTIEHLQESPSSETRYPPEPLAQKVMQDPHVYSEDSNVSADATYSDVQEEESGTLVRMVSLSTGDEQNDNVRPVTELVPTRIFSAHMKAQSEKGEMCKMRDDNVTAEHIDGSDTSKADLHLESYVTPGIENSAHEDMVDKRNVDSFSKLQGGLLGRKSLFKTSNYRECLNADNIRSRTERMVTITAHDIMKEKPVSKGSDQNTAHINAHRSDVQPSTSSEKLRKNISLNIINPGTSSHNMRKAVVKENRISPSKAEMKASEVSTSRATEPKLKPLNSFLQKGLTSIMRNKDQNPGMQGSTVLKRNLSLDTKKQTPPTPTLKRKIFEESVDIPQLTPLKRLSASPCRALPETVVKEQGCNYTSVACDKSPKLDVSLTEIDISSSIENDGIFEKAEACSKELEDVKICRVADAEVAPNLIFSKNHYISYKYKCLFAFGGGLVMI
ncbi:hypothetical protein L1987_35968 [Smallanthus sonchifolius]|uniref:Uncharacterized protein n=1 Tax=Smallanthus sonchifolius TaxID=185202 RepID=A0ACB9HDD4_9ASTR|nr:hypothetical protein L1987_35968 [Smallanthus sonchifolius]